MDSHNKNHCCILARREPANADLWRLDVMYYIRNCFFVTAHHYESFSVKQAVCGWHMYKQWVPGSPFLPHINLSLGMRLITALPVFYSVPAQYDRFEHRLFKHA